MMGIRNRPLTFKLCVDGALPFAALSGLAALLLLSVLVLLLPATVHAQPRGEGAAALLAAAAQAMVDDVDPPANTEAPGRFGTLSESFVLVKVHFKRSAETGARQPGWGDFDEGVIGHYEEFIRNKRPLVMGGVLIAPDTVAVIDTVFHEEHLDRIEVDDLHGGIALAWRMAILKNTNALLLQVDPANDLRSVPLDLAARNVELEDLALELMLESRGAHYVVNSRPLVPSLLFEDGRSARPVPVVETSAMVLGFLAPLPNGANYVGPDVRIQCPSVLLNERDEAVGLAFEEILTDQGGLRSAWRSRQILEGERMELSTLAEAPAVQAESLDMLFAEARITFRRTTGADESGWNGFAPSNGESVPSETYVYGLALSPDLLFVPQRISREEAKVIDTITVFSESGETEGVFQGAYEDYDAFLIRAPGAGLRVNPGIKEPEHLSRLEPILALNATRRFGEKQGRWTYSRYFQNVRGYGDVLAPVFLGDAPRGQVYANFEGKILGICLDQSPEGEEKERFRETARQGLLSYRDYSGLRRVCTPAELEHHFSSPDEHLDKAIVWLPEKKETRKMWFGVEFVGMNADLAKVLDVEAPTKDGQVGMIVSAVYPGSPAARVGLRVGDICLRLREKGEEEAVPLTGTQADDLTFGLGDFELSNTLDGMLAAQEVRVWPTRENTLTQLLEVIGVGKTVELTYLDSTHTELTRDFTVAEAPPDFAGAKKYKDLASGLTVKDITYEVRYALNLTDEFRGVIVAVIEDGSPAAVARMRSYELIVRIDDEDIVSVDQFRSILTRATIRRDREGTATLRLTLQQLDNTHFADLTIEKSQP